jgi:hypothetical protein
LAVDCYLHLRVEISGIHAYQPVWSGLQVVEDEIVDIREESRWTPIRTTVRGGADQSSTSQEGDFLPFDQLGVRDTPSGMGQMPSNRSSVSMSAWRQYTESEIGYAFMEKYSLGALKI